MVYLFKKMRNILMLLFCALTSISQAQKCISQKRLAKRISSNPELNDKIQESDLKIWQWVHQKERSNIKKQEIINIQI